MVAKNHKKLKDRRNKKLLLKALSNLAEKDKTNYKVRGWMKEKGYDK